jgi:CHAD domain-containing protein
MEFNKHYNFHCGSAKKVLTTKWEEYISTLKYNLSQLYSLDADSIHDVRVTSRRIRALYAELKSFYSFPEELLNISKEITRLLGKRRELDVIRELATKIFPNDSPVLSHFCNYIDIKREQQVENCFNTVELVNKVIASHQSILNPKQITQKCYLNYIIERIPILIKRLTKIRKKFKKSSNIKDMFSFEEVHLVRIKLKKIRYSLEIFAIFSEDIREFLQNMKRIQEVIGEWNDERILLNYLKEYYLNTSNLDPASELKRYEIYLNELIEQKLLEIRSEILENFKKQYLKKLWQGLEKIRKLNCC